MTEPATRGSTRTGVVFVHGIGTQPPRDTFLDWAEPVVRMLAALRRERDEDASRDPVGEDPVLVARSVGERVWAELDIPAAADLPADRWVITEAYWAAEVRAPGLRKTLRYLARRLPSVVRGITQGYGRREERRKQRLAAFVEDLAQSEAIEDDSLGDELARAGSRRWAWIDWLDWVWQQRPVRWLLTALGVGLTMVALAFYSLIRAIPIKAVRERAELAILETWLVEWFGDLPVLLEDRVQAAMVRSRLEETIRWLVGGEQCDQVVILAHSGGAIVGYSTLLRLGDENLPVVKLITHGQGLSLGWRLLMTGGALPPGNPLRGDLGTAHPKLRWVDFWATYDPAPAGPLATVPGCPLVADPAPGPPAGSPIRVESRPVTNLMHMGWDHGGYWDNDEGFLVPLLRHIDDPHGDGSGSRFYRSPHARAARIERRRRRVGILVGWRWMAFAAGFLALLGTSASPGLASVGQAVAATVALVPGHEWLAGPIQAVGGAVALSLSLIGLSAVSDWLAALGPALLGAAVPVLGTFLVYRRGVSTWRASDEAEREKIRREALAPEGEAWARSEACLLLGGLAALVVAAVVPPLDLPGMERWTLVLAILVAAAVLGLVIRAWPAVRGVVPRRRRLILGGASRSGRDG